MRGSEGERCAPPLRGWDDELVAARAARDGLRRELPHERLVPLALFRRRRCGRTLVGGHRTPEESRQHSEWIASAAQIQRRRNRLEVRLELSRIADRVALEERVSRLKLKPREEVRRELIAECQSDESANRLVRGASAVDVVRK